MTGHHHPAPRRGRVALVVVVLVILIAVIAWRLRCDRGDRGPGDADTRGDADADAREPYLGVDPSPAGAFDPRGSLRASITGTIRDPEGRPIAGAQVCAGTASKRLPSALTREARCTLSEADGRYRLDDLFGVGYWVAASAPTYVPASYRRVDGARRRGGVDLLPGVEAVGIDITLEGGGVEVHGFVKDLSGGPIEGAELRVVTTVSAAIAHSDAEGRFSLWVKPGESQVTASADGYAEGHGRGIAPGHTFEVFLTPEAVLVGTVVRAGDGAPVHDARVTATAGTGEFNNASAFTDAAGRFRLGGLEPGVYKAEATADELFGRADEQVVLGLGETSAPLVITAHPAFSVRGAVVIAGGDVCEAGSVALFDRTHNRMSHAYIERDGAVHHRGLLPGEYEVTVRCAGQVAAERYDPVTIVDRSLDAIRWEVTPGRAIRGRILDHRGAGVPGMNVQASRKLDPANAGARPLHGWADETGLDGGFEVAGLLAGDYDVVVHAWSSQRASPKPLVISVPEGRDVEGLKIELPATGEAHGRVVDADGRPLAGATVILGGSPRNVTGSTADDGTFVIPDVAAGTYRARAQLGVAEILRSPGKGDDDIQGAPVEIAVDAVTNFELVVESASGVITGVVQDEDGGPVADAFIEARRESERAGAAPSAAVRESRWGPLFTARDPVLSDADGRFTVPRLTAGKHTLLAHRKGGGEGILEHVAPGADVVVTIASTGRMSGTVALAGGGAPEEFTVLVADPSVGFTRSDTFFRSGGAWSLPELPAGDYTVTVTCGAGTARIDAAIVAGQHTEDLRIELAPRITARGTLVDEEGVPVAGMEVKIQDGGGGLVYGGLASADRRNVTGDDGRFEVAEAPTGRVTVSVQARANDAFEWASVPITLSADAPVAEIPPIQLVRRRVPPNEASGTFGFALQEPEPDDDPRERRLVVARVRPGSAAARAGLRVGDEIVRVDNQDVRGARSYLYPLLVRVPVGATITLGLAREVSIAMIAEPMP